MSVRMMGVHLEVGKMLRIKNDVPGRTYVGAMLGGEVVRLGDVGEMEHDVVVMTVYVLRLKQQVHLVAHSGSRIQESAWLSLYFCLVPHLQASSKQPKKCKTVFLISHTRAFYIICIFQFIFIYIN